MYVCKLNQTRDDAEWWSEKTGEYSEANYQECTEQRHVCMWTAAAAAAAAAAARSTIKAYDNRQAVCDVSNAIPPCTPSVKNEQILSVCFQVAERCHIGRLAAWLSVNAVSQHLQGGTKNGATISLQIFWNSMTELRGNWWTYAILYAELSH